MEQRPAGWYPAGVRKRDPSQPSPARGGQGGVAKHKHPYRPTPRRDTMLPLNRRQFLHAAGAGAAVLGLGSLAAAEEKKKAEGFSLPKLPYAYDALEPEKI